MNAIKIRVLLASVTELPFPDNHFDTVFTDPPYYDNVPYSYLSLWSSPSHRSDNF